MSAKQTTTMNSPQPPYPLHPSVADKLDPQYVAIYNKYMINSQQIQYLPVAEFRSSNKSFPGKNDDPPVGETRDVAIPRKETSGPDVMVRCFIPEGEAPANGWPVMVYYHGGGWVFGNLDSDKTVCAHMCSRAGCVVVTTDYRLAPENPFPAALHDSWEALLWTASEGAKILNLNTSLLAMGGSSAGGNLAAATTQKLASRPDLRHITCKRQLLVVPITDNTATVSSNPTYASYEHTPALPAEKILWYRNHYLPDPSAWTSIEASPLLAESGIFAKLPRAIVLVGELDVLRWEGEEYARKLQEAGVDARVEVMKGMPHMFLAMSAVLDEGKRAITILCEELMAVFG